MCFVMISALLVTPHTDFEQSSFEIDYDYHMKDVNMSKTKSPVMGKNPSMVLLPVLVRATGQVQKRTLRAVATLILQCFLTIHAP